MSIIEIMVDREGTKEIHKFDRSTEANELLEYVTTGYAFRIPSEAGRYLWNEIVVEEWGGLDDSDYYSHEMPFIWSCDWFTEVNGTFITVASHMDNLERDLNIYEELRRYM